MYAIDMIAKIRDNLRFTLGVKSLTYANNHA
jgi:hypothetical protein